MDEPTDLLAAVRIGETTWHEREAWLGEEERALRSDNGDDLPERLLLWCLEQRLERAIYLAREFGEALCPIPALPGVKARPPEPLK